MDFWSTPALVILVFAFGAAHLSAFGALPYYVKEGISAAWLGVSEALAGGCMLGIGFLLLSHEADVGWRPVIGAGLGVLLVYAVQGFFALPDADLATDPATDLLKPPPNAAYSALLYGALHAGMEGIAIGAAVLESTRLGVFLVATLALHNIAEGVSLTQLLRERAVPLKVAAGLCVMVKLPQTLTALSVYAVVSALGWLLPWLSGFAAGGLFYVVLTDLLPASYRHSRHLTVAILTSAAAAFVVLSEGMLG